MNKLLTLLTAALLAMSAFTAEAAPVLAATSSVPTLSASTGTKHHHKKRHKHSKRAAAKSAAFGQ